MSDPTPLTDAALMGLRAAVAAAHVDVPNRHTLAGLLATVDAERARREQAERELAATEERRQGWQNAARDQKARADQAEAEGLVNVRKMDDLRMAEIKQLKAQRDAADSVIRWLRNDSQPRLAMTATESDVWLHGDGITWSPMTSAEADAICRALDASPTEGNPDAD